MTKISRRSTIKYLAMAGLSPIILAKCQDPSTTDQDLEEMIEDAGIRDLSPEDLKKMNEKFFSDQEREIVRILANMIIPSDERSGNAEEVGTVQFIEFMMLDMKAETNIQTVVRGGLKWLDLKCLEEFQQSFTACGVEQRSAIVDLIAYPDIAEPENTAAVSFFNTFRNFVATGFWTSKMGIEDLQYMGNVATVWDGAPQEWLDRLGVSYDS